MDDSATCYQLTDEEILDGQKIAIQEDPLKLVEHRFLRIKTKGAGLVNLKLNSCQRIIIDIIKEKMNEGKPVRAWVLKARQEGVSTLTEAVIYAFTSQQNNVNSLILADEKEHANNLFEMSKLYQEKLTEEHPHLAPKLKRSNEKKLEFDGILSQIIIASAENTESAKSHTFQMVHLSEIAYFRDFEKIMGDLNQTVPDLPGTLVIGETTANGMNMFYDEWIKAIEGTTSWIPIFIPWFVLDEYSMPLENGELYPIGGIKFESELTKVMFSEEEVKIKEENELTDEQINWRRYAIVNKCGGDLNRFDQEYPTCWEDAFKMSGKLFFDKNGLEKQESKVPISTGEIALVDNMYTFRELPTGRIKIYAYPVQGDTYVVAGDTSEAVGNDEAGLLVLNKRTNETVAVVVGQVPPEDIANLGVDLAEFYNKAVLAIENRGYGYAANQTAYRRYGNVYRKVITRKGTIERTQDLGFNTNSVTRPEMLSRMAEEVSINSTKLVDKDLIDECYTFVNKFDKYGNFQKTEAATSKQDGLVICRAIAGQVRYEQPHKPVVSTRRIPSKVRNSVPLKRKKNAGIAYRSS